MTSLHDILKDLNKKVGKDVVTMGMEQEEFKRIPFSSPALNFMTHGGLPRNVLIEFFGESSSGKSTASLDIIANAQRIFKQEWNEEIKELESSTKKSDQKYLEELKERGHKKALFVDAENSLYQYWAKSFDIDLSPDSFVYYKPEGESAEEIFENIRQMIKTGELGLVVLDSLGVLYSDQQSERTIGEKTYAGISQPLTTFSKFLIQDCTKHRCTFIGINQLRANLASPYGGKTTVGGNAWGFNCTVRLEFRKDKMVDEKGAEVSNNHATPMGQVTKVFLAKTKGFKPDRKLARFTFNFSGGVDYIKDTIELAIEMGIIEKTGAWLSLIDTATGELIAKKQGLVQMKEYLAENRDQYDTLLEKVLSHDDVPITEELDDETV